MTVKMRCLFGSRDSGVGIRVVIAIVMLGSYGVLTPLDVTAQAPAASAWAPARTPDGQPDIRGVWNPVAGGASHSLEQGAEPEQDAVLGGERETTRNARRGQLSIKVSVEADGNLPFQPWAAARRQEHLVNLATPTKWAQLDPEDRCLLSGVPRSNYRGTMQVLQTPGHVTILYEWNHAYRVIPLDAGPHPPSDVRLWNGDSRGRWEGNTLVVDVTNFKVDSAEFNMQPWFDSHGTFYSDALHVVERWTPISADTMRYEATVEDPKVFTRPWQLTMTINRNRQAAFELIEEACFEGDRNTANMVSAGRVAKAKGESGIHTHAPK